MNFQISDSELARGSIMYVAHDRAFQTCPSPPHAGSVQINELELLIAADGRVVGLSGFCPHDGWTKAALRAPHSISGAVHCSDGLNADGIPIRYNREKRWNVFYDSSTELVFIGISNPTVTATTVEIMERLALGFERGSLTHLWIRCHRVL